MCADFRVKCEVEVRGLTALFLYAAYRRHAVSPVPRRGICEKPRATLPRALSCRIPFFRVGREGQKSRLRTNKTRGQRGGSETLTYVCYDRNLWELNEKKDASAA